MKGRRTRAVSRGLSAGEVHASGPASQEVVPALAPVGPIAKASSASESSRGAAGSKAVVLENEVGISGGWEGKCLGVAWQQAWLSG